jgi:hypothetical protein
MNFTVPSTRRSGSTSRGRSAERRHGSTSRVPPTARQAGGPSSILDDSVNAQQQQLLILRKPVAVGRQPTSAAAATASSGPNSALSRSGEARAGAPGRLRSGSAEPRPAPARPAAAALEDGVASLRSPPMSPTTLLQNRLTEEATQLRWEVVADSSRVRELQDKRAGGGKEGAACLMLRDSSVFLDMTAGSDMAWRLATTSHACRYSTTKGRASKDIRK